MFWLLGLFGFTLIIALRCLWLFGLFVWRAVGRVYSLPQEKGHDE
jgi:hypothetical protein